MQTYTNLLKKYLPNPIGYIKSAHTPAPDLVFLNLTIDSILQPARHVLTHILLAARPKITRLWKTDRAPTIEHTLDLVNLHYGYELTMASSGSYMTKGKTHGYSGSSGLELRSSFDPVEPQLVESWYSSKLDFNVLALLEYRLRTNESQTSPRQQKRSHLGFLRE